MSAPSTPSLLADRRWLIGIGISVAFGLFGAVMALLSYADRGKRQAPLAAPAATAPATPPAAAVTPESKSRGKGRGKD